MNNFNLEKNHSILQQLIKNVGCATLREFSLQSKVSELQLLRLKNGLLAKIPLETAVEIAQGLNISLNELMSLFYRDQDVIELIFPSSSSTENEQNLASQQFQLSTVETLESFLLQLPTVIAAVQKNPDLPATRLLPLWKPIEQLLASWNISPLASVGAKIPYNPREHQLMEGTAEIGDLVEVRYVGYRQQDNLLYRAKVSPIY